MLNRQLMLAPWVVPGLKRVHGQNESIEDWNKLGFPRNLTLAIERMRTTTSTGLWVS